jgi:hypothetical protein
LGLGLAFMLFSLLGKKTLVSAAILPSHEAEIIVQILVKLFPLHEQ